MFLTKLYKLTRKNKVQTWQIEIEGNKYRTHEGEQNGVITTTEWTLCKGKNTGRANATTAEEQALKAATSKHNKRIETDHFYEDIEDVHNGPKYTKVMLAENYNDYKNRLDFEEGVAVQTKYNGVRCVAEKKTDVVELFSRKGKKYVSCPHIQEALRPLFEEYPNLKLDGELFNESLREDLGGLIKLVRKQKVTAEDLKKSHEVVHLYLYDIITDGTTNFEQNNYEKRYEILSALVKLLHESGVKDRFKIVLSPTWWVKSYEEIDAKLKENEDNGHEGLIIRRNKPYVHDRTEYLLKYKSWIEEEFTIIEVIEGEGNLRGKVGAFLLVDENGRKFKSSPTGSHEYWEMLWNDKELLENVKATVKYKELTPITENGGGVPSFGKVVAIRNYE